jgi:hypothetical protein
MESHMILLNIAMFSGLSFSVHDNYFIKTSFSESAKKALHIKKRVHEKRKRIQRKKAGRLAHERWQHNRVGKEHPKDLAQQKKTINHALKNEPTKQPTPSYQQVLDNQAEGRKFKQNIKNRAKKLGLNDKEIASLAPNEHNKTTFVSRQKVLGVQKYHNNIMKKNLSPDEAVNSIKDKKPLASQLFDQKFYEQNKGAKIKLNHRQTIAEAR